MLGSSMRNVRGGGSWNVIFELECQISDFNEWELVLENSFLSLFTQISLGERVVIEWVGAREGLVPLMFVLHSALPGTSAVSFPWKSIGVLRLIVGSPFLQGNHLLGERYLHVTISLRETTCYLDGVVCVGAVGRWWIVYCSIALLLGFWSFVRSSFWIHWVSLKKAIGLLFGWRNWDW